MIILNYSEFYLTNEYEIGSKFALDNSIPIRIDYKP